MNISYEADHERANVFLQFIVPILLAADHSGREV
jgi:hypothetical protein